MAQLTPTQAASRGHIEALAPADILAREAQRGPRAGYVALLSALLLMGGGIALQAIYADIPRVLLVDALRDAAGQNIGRAGLLTDRILFFDDKAVSLLGVSVVQALAVLGAAFVLAYLYNAAIGRGARLPRFAKLIAMFGGVATALGYVGVQAIVSVLAHDFATSSDQGTQAAHDALRSGGLIAAQFVGDFAGRLSLALAFVLIPLHAMRVGLLTRFLGILGIIAGVLLIIPLGGSVYVVQAFWLAAIGILILRRWPRGMPLAWETGQAQPWPTQQELREQREGARGSGDVSEAARDMGLDADMPRTGAPSPATSKKRKRKRRS